MRRLILDWLKLHEDELALFLWTAGLLFLMRSSGMILNNYAETAFLKRYGVEYLPIVNMLNSVATFVLTAIIALFMSRFSSRRLLGALFIFCGLSAAAIRLLIPTGADWIYPLLFMLKSQFELIVALVFWNLANDLYNTRQSKRIFPLLTAGGVIGLIAGSFGTPLMADVLNFDNLLLIYLGLSIAGAVTVKGMGMHMRLAESGGEKEKKISPKPPISKQFSDVLPLIRESTLVKIVLVLNFMPNVVITIMNYQFNFAADAYFASESGLLGFFSYFRGVLNIISLILLLFVGRLYGRFGLPVALMFHPLNYIIAFTAFFLRFDIFSAIYARMSTNIIRTTVNMPASSILIGLFPESYRAMVRPFLRGTVVRAALFLGSGLILASSNLFHPRYLSLVALPFVLCWLGAPLVLKRKYASILNDLISQNMLDLKSMEQENLGRLFKKEQADEKLAETFLNSRGDEALWYARLLKTLDVKDFGDLVAESIWNQDTETRIRMLELLPDNPGPKAAEMLSQMLYSEISPELTVAVINTARRTGSGNPAIRKRLESFIRMPAHPEVRGHAAGCLYTRDPEKLGKEIDTWLKSKNISQRKSGVIAAGQTGEKDYAAALEKMLSDPENEPIAADILRSLALLAPDNLNQLAAGFIDHHDSRLRLAALETIGVNDENSFSLVIQHLGDSDEAIANLAKEKIKNADYINGQALIEALNLPNSRLRESIFHLLEALKIKDLDLVRFTRQGIFQAYICLAKLEALKKVPETKAKDLLKEHLTEKKDLLMQNTLRVLAIHDRKGRMWTAFKGLFSPNIRHRANSIELLGDIMDHKIFRIVAPLLEGESTSQSLAEGKKYLKLPKFIPVSKKLFPALLRDHDWIEPVLGLYLLAHNPEEAQKQKSVIAGLKKSLNPHVRLLAQKIDPDQTGALDQKEQIMDTELTVPEKILLLKNIAIFSGLTVSQLGAIAAVTREIYQPHDQVVIAEGDPGDRVYLIIEGEVAVCKGMEPDKQIRLDTMGPGDYFGEMALFEETQRSATIRTLKPSRFLVLEKPEFNELVREYPAIALKICTELSHRLRHLQSRVAEAEAVNKPEKDQPCK